MTPEAFFDLVTPRDMLQKARRELDRFESDPCADHAFNFFVTVSHIQDWAKQQGVAFSAIAADPDFELCRLACNKGKHFLLKGRTLERAEVRQFQSHADCAFFGTEQFTIEADHVSVDVATLGRRILAKITRTLG